MVAIERGYCDIAMLLVDEGAMLDIQDKQGGRTALMQAALLEENKMAVYLIENGADYSLTDNQGRNVLGYRGPCEQQQQLQEAMDIADLSVYQKTTLK